MSPHALMWFQLAEEALESLSYLRRLELKRISVGGNRGSLRPSLQSICCVTFRPRPCPLWARNSTEFKDLSALRGCPALCHPASLLGPGTNWSLIKCCVRLLTEGFPFLPHFLCLPGFWAVHPWPDGLYTGLPN